MWISRSLCASIYLIAWSRSWWEPFRWLQNWGLDFQRLREGHQRMKGEMMALAFRLKVAMLCDLRSAWWMSHDVWRGVSQWRSKDMTEQKWRKNTHGMLMWFVGWCDSELKDWWIDGPFPTGTFSGSILVFMGITMGWLSGFWLQSWLAQLRPLEG